MGSDEEVVDQICEFVNWLPWEIVFFFKYQPTIRSSQIYIVRKNWFPNHNTIRSIGRDKTRKANTHAAYVKSVKQ